MEQGWIFRLRSRGSEPVVFPVCVEAEPEPGVPGGVVEAALSRLPMVAWPELAGAERELRRKMEARRDSEGIAFFFSVAVVRRQRRRRQAARLGRGRAMVWAWSTWATASFLFFSFSRASEVGFARLGRGGGVGPERPRLAHVAESLRFLFFYLFFFSV